MKIIKQLFLGTLLLLPIRAITAAPDVLDVYQQALANDLVLAQALHNRDAEIENLPIA